MCVDVLQKKYHGVWSSCGHSGGYCQLRPAPPSLQGSDIPFPWTTQTLSPASAWVNSHWGMYCSVHSYIAIVVNEYFTGIVFMCINNTSSVIHKTLCLVVFLKVPCIGSLTSLICPEKTICVIIMPFKHNFSFVYSTSRISNVKSYCTHENPPNYFVTLARVLTFNTSVSLYHNIQRSVLWMTSINKRN